MKERPLLVGGGVIAAHYRRAFSTSRRYELCALADIDEHCPARALYDVPFYTDARTAAGKSKAEVSLLATPCATHYPLARKLLALGVKVITEKPMCDTLDRVKELLSSERAGCLFHWSHAEEVSFLREHLKEWGKIQRICAHICDDYAAGGSVRADRRGLGGAWRDSGINVLSYFGELLDLGGAKLLSSEVVRDGGGQDVYAKKRFRFGETEGEILVDWRSADSRKVSVIECARGLLEIDHTAQTVRLDDMRIGGDGAERVHKRAERSPVVETDDLLSEVLLYNLADRLNLSYETVRSLKAEGKIKVYLLGFGQLVYTGGKPQFYFVIVIDRDVDLSALNARKANKHKLDYNKKMVEAERIDLKDENGYQLSLKLANGKRMTGEAEKSFFIALWHMQTQKKIEGVPDWAYE